jgi:mannitol/fructose-specific phosphotransferase system IIA component (Ntr-type)
MDLEQIIDRERCCVLTETTKTEVIIELADRLGSLTGPAVKGGELDVETLKKELFYREQLMSTGIGLGLAVPHVRYSGILEPIIIAGVQPQGIADYDSLDGEPVRIVIMIIVGEHQHKQHIRLLSMIVARLKDPGVRERLLQSVNGEDIYNALTGAGRSGGEAL